MKSLKITICIFLTLIAFTIRIHFANANPVIVDYKPTYLHLLWILLGIPSILISTIVLEYFIFSALTQDRTLSGSDLFKSVAVVNLFTFPITQLLAILVAISSQQIAPFHIYLYFFVELVPISLEFVLFLYIFNKVLEIRPTTNSAKIFTNTLAANMISFAIGLVPTVFYLLAFHSQNTGLIS